MIASIALLAAFALAILFVTFAPAVGVLGSRVTLRDAALGIAVAFLAGLAALEIYGANRVARALLTASVVAFSSVFVLALATKLGGWLAMPLDFRVSLVVMEAMLLGAVALLWEARARRWFRNPELSVESRRP